MLQYFFHPKSRPGTFFFRQNTTCKYFTLFSAERYLGEKLSLPPKIVFNFSTIKKLYIYNAWWLKIYKKKKQSVSSGESLLQVTFGVAKNRQWCSKACNDCFNVRTNSKLQHPPPPPPSKARAFELLKIGSFKFPPLLGQNTVQMLYPIAWFLCEMPLLKRNPPVVFNKTCIYENTPTHISWPFIWRHRLQKHNFNIENY